MGVDQALAQHNYNAYYYDSGLGRFISPDTIVPNPANPQSLNRYAYTYNNPLKYRDSSGHFGETLWDIANIVIGVGSLCYNLSEGNYVDAAIDTGGLVVDVAATALPFVPGGAGAAIKAVRVANKVDNVVDAVNAADNVVDTVNAVDNVVDAANQIDNATDAANQADNLLDAANHTSPDFVVTEDGVAIPVPNGATRPTPVRTGRGFQYTGGSGGKGLAPETSNVRIMDPTTPNPPSPGYPKGYASYSNSASPSPQTVNPYTGRTISKSDPWWHIPLEK